MKRQWKDYQIIIFIGIITFGLIGICKGSAPNCIHESNGNMYPNTLDCSTFWVCEYERPALVQCDEGLLYDSELKVCNWWFAVDCGNTPILTTTEKPFTTEIINTNQTTIGITKTTEKTTTAAPETTVTQEGETTTRSQPETNTPSEPETTTNQELVTTSLSESEITTGTELLTTTTMGSETATTSELQTTDVQETTALPSTYPDCENIYEQVFYPHLTDPSKYFICAGKFPIELQCPSKFLWNQEYKSCISTEIPDETCTKDEYIPHPDEEQYYYQCIDGKPALSLCPSNLKWNQDLLKCADEATTQPTYPNCDNINGQIYFPHLTDITKYYFCAGIYPVELPCPSQFQWFQIYERCARTNISESEEELIDCSTEKFAVHPSAKQMYLECIDNKPIIKVCPSDFRWDQDILDCIKEIPEETQYPQCENSKGQIYFPHLTDSSKYYICAGNYAIELTCPATYVWYQEYQSCATTELSESEEETVDCTIKQYFSYENDLHMYYRCIDETPILIICPENLIWNQELLQCTNEDSIPKYPQCESLNGQIYYPHLTDASKYYICVGEFALELFCPSGFIWTQDHQSCAKTETSQQETDVIDCSLQSGPQSAPHEDNVQFYYLCIAEQPVLMLCPSDLKWDQISQKCTAEITPDPSYPQCSNPTGQIYFPHLTDLSKYYICAGEFAVELPCPTNFLWSQEHQSCVRNLTPEETEEILVCSIEDEPQYIPNSDDDQLYYHCIEDKPILMLCPSDLKWSQELLQCTDELPISKYPQCNNSNGQNYFAHLTDDTRYYICAGIIPLELSCPTNYKWNQDYESCIADVISDEEYPLKCEPTDNLQHISHPTDSQKYFVCMDHRPALLHCPSNATWDDKIAKCIMEIRVEPNYPPCGNGPIFYPHLTEPNQYYLCSGEYALTMTCPNDYIWSIDINSCIENISITQEPDIDIEEPNSAVICNESGIFLPHATDASKYYACVGTPAVSILFSCTGNTFWIASLQRCDAPDMNNLPSIPSVNFPEPDCSNGDEFLTNYQDCQKYYICIGGVLPLEFTCEENAYWDPTDNKCVKDKSKCFAK